MKQLDLLIEGVRDALRLCIQKNPHGYNLTKFAKRLIWPAKDEAVAKNMLSQILHGQRGIYEEELKAILHGGDPEPFIRWLCQEFGFKPPERAKPVDLEAEIHRDISEIKRVLSNIEKRVNRQS